MSQGLAINLFRSGILQVLMIAGPILLVGMVVGLIVSIFQATTSIQEQTLTFIPKIAAILGAAALLGPWIMNSMMRFVLQIFDQISEMIF